MRKLVKISVAALLAVSVLSGCAFSDPRIEGAVPAEPSSMGDFSQAGDDVHTAWEAVAGMAALDPSNQQWGLMTETLASQWIVLVGPDPLNRIQAKGADIGDPGSFASVDDGKTAADDALTTARDSALSQANSSTGLATAFWASLAAGLEQVRLGLSGAYDPAPKPDSNATVTIVDEPTALSELISRYDEAIFAIRSSMGFLDPADPDQSYFKALLSTLQSNLADLTDLAVTAQATPTPHGIYELPDGRGHDAAFAMLASTQKALTEASVVWAASTSAPATATPYVMSNATFAMDYGLGTAAWPGWPDSE